MVVMSASVTPAGSADTGWFARREIGDVRVEIILAVLRADLESEHLA